MKSARKMKLTGKRSMASKLRRLAYELEHDANRMAVDHPELANISAGVRAISSRCGDLARTIEE